MTWTSVVLISLGGAALFLIFEGLVKKIDWTYIKLILKWMGLR